MIGDFFSNPDGGNIGAGFSNPDGGNMSASNDDEDFGFGLEGLQQDGAWTVTNDFNLSHAHDSTRVFHTLNSPHNLRPESSHEQQFAALSRQNVSPFGNGVHQPFATSFDDGHMGVSAASTLMNMSHDSPRMQRNGSRRSSDVHMPPVINPYNPVILQSGHYTPSTTTFMSNHSPVHAPVHAAVHAPTMASFHSANGGQSWNTPSRPNMIPDALPFNTDQTFAYSPGPSTGFNANGSLTGAEKARRRNLQGNFPQYQDAAAFANDMAPPSRTKDQHATQVPVQRSATSIPTTLGPDDQVLKRIRTTSIPQLGIFPADAFSSPPSQLVKGEPSSSRRGSSASAQSGTNSASPVPAPVPAPAAPRRKQQQASGNQSVPQPAGAKRQKLSDSQRKANHILSEKRRRADMKKGYDQLDKLVPSLKSGGLSKSQVLQQTVIFLDALVEGNKKVEKEIARRLAGMGSNGVRAGYNMVGTS
ncbi:hypothetical protein K461DRAFT_124569 [Myriangium duriaei CBS 260.36]|uniref:BHLH domain-containing protein n=1 Tax=Myriangium duriaei CBS 260.36 TaxID=1168546 RepID=A0A9P4J2D7_9PEZI|nr:hypothetical protein K461DRAFT_124569 [Myriangium duriaei CBS 260.36]